MSIKNMISTCFRKRTGFGFFRPKMGKITIFHWSRSAEKFVQEFYLHSIHFENHELKMFSFSLPEKVRYVERT